MKILIVYNSEKYGGDTTAYQCAEILNSSDVQTSIIKFDTRVTREIPCAGYDAVVAVGGDGTIIKVAKCAAAVNIPISVPKTGLSSMPLLSETEKLWQATTA